MQAAAVFLVTDLSLFAKARAGLVLQTGPSGKRRWMRHDEWADLVDRAVHGGASRTTRNAEWGDFSLVDGSERSELESAIKQHLGVDVSLLGYAHHASEDVVRKVLADHGDQQNETARGQLPVTLDDLKKLPSWIHAGKVVDVGRTRDGLVSITRAHVDQDEITYVQEVRTGRKKLALKTMWKRPGRAAPASTASAQLPTTAIPGPLNSTIPDKFHKSMPSRLVVFSKELPMNQFTLLKSHIDAYTRKDGAVVQAHDDSRVKMTPAQVKRISGRHVALKEEHGNPAEMTKNEGELSRSKAAWDKTDRALLTGDKGDHKDASYQHLEAANQAASRKMEKHHRALHAFHNQFSH